MGGRAAVAQLLHRGVRGPRGVRSRLVRMLSPAGADALRLPRPAGEERGRGRAYAHRIRRGSSRIRITRAGTPPTTALAGTSEVTTELVPITALSPTVTPRRMQAP